MDLLGRVTGIVLSEEKASRTLGTLFMVIRLSVNAPAFAAIQQAIPEVGVWVKKSLSGAAARTGEMLALTDSSNVSVRLQVIGLNDIQIQQVAKVITERLSGILDMETMEALNLRLPLLATTHA